MHYMRGCGGCGIPLGVINILTRFAPIIVMPLCADTYTMIPIS